MEAGSTVQERAAYRWVALGGSNRSGGCNDSKQCAGSGDSGGTSAKQYYLSHNGL
jgi:hypothetical protein